MIPRHFQITIAFLLLAILLSGIYFIQLRQRERAKTPADTVELGAQSAGKAERVRLLVAYDDDQALRWRQSDILLPTRRDLRAREIMRTLLAQYIQRPSPHPLAVGSDIRHVYVLHDDTLLVDTNSAFADAHPSGVLLEQLTLASLIETIFENVPGIIRVKFLVEGKERETLAGHADLTRFYETSAVHQLAREFE